jgi:hypothetical protein
MPAGEPAHQPVCLGERVGRVDIVEDQQPARITGKPGEHGVEPHLLLGHLAFRQQQWPGETRQVTPQFLR